VGVGTEVLAKRDRLSCSNGGVWIWLGLVAASASLAVTVVLFDRTTLIGVTRQWLLCFVVCFALFLSWWARPRITSSGIKIESYDSRSLRWVALPLVSCCLGLVIVVYAFDSVHQSLYSRLYYERLMSDRTWPVAILTACCLSYVVLWCVRELLLGVAKGLEPRWAALAAVAAIPSLMPAGVAFLGLLLGTASLAMINVNYWRYWATVDGWTMIGHYPMTMTDSLHVESGNVSPYFVSFPLLPAMLAVSFSLLGHNTLGAYAPLILSNAVLAIAAFLLIREITKSSLLAFLFSSLVVSFPLLRNYTLDMAEADVALMAMVSLASYLKLRAARADAHLSVQALSGVFAGLASLARPEGVLYMAAMYLASFREQWRKRAYWVSTLAWGIALGLFSAVSVREFGMIWPGNHSGTLRLANFVDTVRVADEAKLFSTYAAALGVSEDVLVASLALAAVLLLFASVRMVRKDLALTFMPVAAVGNVIMVFFVGPVPAEAAKWHDFFRHISYGFPLIVATMAYGIVAIWAIVPASWERAFKSLSVALIVALVVFNLSVLRTPVSPGNQMVRPLMTSDVHILATELLVNPLELPTMRFQHAEGRYVPIADDYLNVFPDPLSQHYSRSDIRSAGNAVEYYQSATVLFFGMLGALLLAIFAHWRARPSSTA